MDLNLLIAAFGGGVIGAAFGAIPAFIITGILAIAGGLIAMAGIPELSVGSITFGVFWGPHIAFTGAAAATAVAALKRHKVESSGDVLTPLYTTKDIPTLLSGGAFAVVGFLFYTLFTTKLSFLHTDAPGASVFCTLMLCRLIIGKTGPVGSLKEKRDWIPKAESGVFVDLILGAAFGLVIGAVGYVMNSLGISPEAMASYPVVCFGISAASLIFLQAGFGIPITHHISFPAALAYVLSGNILVAVLVGAINAVAWHFAGNIINTNGDTYIDPPATVIMISVALINLIF